MRIFVLRWFMALALGGMLVITAQDNSDIALTVYNSGTALIRDLRTLSLDEGINTISLSSIAETIDPTSVIFRALSDPSGMVVLEQSYRPDRHNAASLLSRYLGETVSITTDDGLQFSGEALRINEDKVVLRTGSNAVAFIRLNDVRSVQFPTLPDALQSDATLRILLDSASAGSQEVELTYLAGGMNWTADYNLFLAADEASLDLKGMVTLNNRSGRSYPDAKLNLVAGDISRIEPEPEFVESRVYAMSASADAASAIEQFDISDYKLYKVGRRVTIKDNETKQIEFVSGRAIKSLITYVFDHSPSNRGYYSPNKYSEEHTTEAADVLTRLAFYTGSEQGLGADLPAGRARVYKADADGARQLIGESTVNHTPEGEAVALQIGKSFDLTGERIQSELTFVSWLVALETIEIRLRNRKDDRAVEIIVPERLYRWRDWQIIESSHHFVKVDSASIKFAVTVEAGAEEVLTYKVQYSFPDDD